MNELSGAELAGRIEAISRFALQLAAELEMNGVIDGPKFCRRLRGPRRLHDQVEYLRIGQQRLVELSNMLDAARSVRLRDARARWRDLCKSRLP